MTLDWNPVTGKKTTHCLISDTTDYDTYME